MTNKLIRALSSKYFLNTRKDLGLSSHQDILKEISATQHFAALDVGGFLPVTSSSLPLSSIQMILNDIFLNKREVIVEFGSGVSTVYIAALLKQQRLPYRFVSLEENSDWTELLLGMLRQRSLEKFVELVYCPLEPFSSSNGSETWWYSLDEAEKVLPAVSEIHCAIVDGPTAYRPQDSQRRSCAGQFLVQRISDNASIFLDDIDRAGEQAAVRAWGDSYGWKFRKFSPSMGVCLLGSARNIK